MRIGELAAAVGVTTRTVRHYHHVGLLPQAERRSNGYRHYTLRHAVVLARIRLTELGLGLAEVRDVLAEVAGRDLVDVLEELDADLARQEAALRERRARLRALLDAGELPTEGPLSPELTALFAGPAAGPSGSPLAASPIAAKDREVLALLLVTVHTGPPCLAPGAEPTGRVVAGLEQLPAQLLIAGVLEAGKPLSHGRPEVPQVDSVVRPDQLPEQGGERPGRPSGAGTQVRARLAWRMQQGITPTALIIDGTGS
ncbi:MerR family transcriptional regulator [Streptomyces sp. NRRL S-340]|uniref:MerR family transcriptional regulator n=1 Tax=Streptomyces sp. NRRL S-340 TaxID=1463901 RepID=UPI00099B8F84|nr:MerR family transcriptional regulator [Streptomyces sp. NRRL S-340]